jgi:hypothetical protein
LADADLWMKKVDGHWEYIATYVDDILSFSKDPMSVIKSLEKSYVLKGVGEPEYYLGGDIEITPKAKVALTAKTYILRAVEKYEQIFAVDGNIILNWMFPICLRQKNVLYTADL